MAIVAGIDEAGYGPVLGPMVTSFSAFDVPESKADCSLWELLKNAVSNGLKDRRERLAVCDSKRLYNARTGLLPLENVVFSFLRVKNIHILSFSQLLDNLFCTRRENFSVYPWYAQKDISLPYVTNEASLLNYIDMLLNNLARQDILFSAVWCNALTVREFNEEVRRYGNKSSVLFKNSILHVKRLWKESEGKMRVVIDKQGGRNRYLHLLKKQFPQEGIKILEEGREISSYVINGDGKEMKLSFTEKGETISMAAALASIFSKYIRELFMLLENQYWLQLVPNLKPTAGYYKDAQRFLSQIAHIKREKVIQDDILIRIK